MNFLLNRKKVCKKNIHVRRIGILAGFIFLICSQNEVCFASQNDDSQVMDSKTTDSDSEEEQIEQDILEDLDLEDVDQTVEEIIGGQISLADMVKKLIKGGQVFDWDTWSDAAAEAVRETLGIRKKTWAHILLLVLLSAVLTNIAAVFENKQVGETSFYVIYLLLFVILLKSFEEFSDQISRTLLGITEFMRALLPSYYLVLSASVGVSTAGIFYQAIIILIYLAENVLLKFLLPGIRVYLLVALINELTGEQFLSKMTELLKDSILWAMKTIIGVVVGIQLIQRLVSPAVDALRQTVIGKTAGAIPGIGNIFSGITEMVLGSAILIKNCLGAAAVVVLLLTAVPPIIKLGISTLFYQFAAACVQPVADKRMVGCLHAMGESIGMLLKLLLAVELLFLLTIAILAGSLG